MKKPNITRDHVKKVTSFVVGRAVSGVVVTALHQHVTTETKMQNASLYLGAYVIGSMVADAARDHTDKQIDEIADTIAEMKTGIAKAKAAAQQEAS